MLSGCTSDFGPWAVPSGYTHHNEKYKAPPGPEPVFKKWEMSGRDGAPPSSAPIAMNTHLDDGSGAVIVADPPSAPSAVNNPQLWQAATTDLTDRLFGKMGKPTERVYLPPPGMEEEDGFYAAALRSVLQQKAIPLSDSPGDGPFTLRYSTASLGDGSEGRRLLTVSILSGKQSLFEESGIYTVGGAADSSAAPASLAPSGESGL